MRVSVRTRAAMGDDVNVFTHILDDSFRPRVEETETGHPSHLVLRTRDGKTFNYPMLNVEQWTIEQ